MTIYTLPEPFETFAGGSKGWVVAYNDATGSFVWAAENGWQAAYDDACLFNPPPPIPAAARKPKVGDVWVNEWEDVYFLLRRNGDSWSALAPDGKTPLLPGDVFHRPATLEEAEPFRPLLNGLKAALGEGK